MARYVRGYLIQANSPELPLQKNSQDRKKSHHSISLYNEHGTHTNTESLRRSNQRRLSTFPVITAVNQKRHTSCKVPIDPVEFSPGMTTYIQWQRSFIAQRNNMIFHNPEKPPGTKLNLYRAERTYSSKNFMELKRKQYMQRLNQNRRAFQGVQGIQEWIYMNYMRYINQSKTVPLPSKSGWRRPKWLPKSVTSGKSTKDNSQKQRTTETKAYSSTNVLQKSKSVQFENSKPEIKKQAKTEMQKPKSSKEPLFTDKAVIVIRSPQRLIPSFLRSPNRPSKGQTNSGSQESTEKAEDIHSKDELTNSTEKGDEVEGENSDKPLSSGDQNHQRQPRHEEEVDIPLSVQGHASPNGSIYETMQEEDQKSIDFKQRGYTDEMSKKSQENESPPFAVESPEAGTSTSSKVKENLQKKEEKEPLTYFEQSEYEDEMNSQEHPQPLAAESPESGKGTSSKVHEIMQEDDQKSTGLEQSESAGEMNKTIQEHNTHSSTIERPESGKDSSTNVHDKLQEEENKPIELEQRESVDEMDRKSQEHDNRASPAERQDSVKKTSNEVHENLEDENKKSTDLEKCVVADDMNQNSQKHDSRPSTAKRPESGKSTSSRCKDPQTQASINGVEEKKT